MRENFIQPLENESPFQYIERVEFQNTFQSFSNLNAYFKLTVTESKCLSIVSIVFQEKFCRQRICNSRERGGSRYGNHLWFQRRFKSIPDIKRTVLFDEFWRHEKDMPSLLFYQGMTYFLVMENQLNEVGQTTIAKLARNYDVNLLEPIKYPPN